MVVSLSVQMLIKLSLELFMSNLTLIPLSMQAQGSLGVMLQGMDST